MGRSPRSPGSTATRASRSSSRRGDGPHPTTSSRSPRSGSRRRSSSCSISLEDPQNVGTLLRTAESSGVHGAIFPTHHQAPLSPAAIKASAGAVEHLQLAPVDDLAGALADLHARGLRIVGADGDAPLTAREADLRGPVAIVVGSEGRGLSAAVRRRCDLLVRIPMHGRIESLNAAVAGSILLYEAAAQRELHAERPMPASRVLGTADGAADEPAPADEVGTPLVVEVATPPVEAVADAEPTVADAEPTAADAEQPTDPAPVTAAPRKRSARAKAAPADAAVPAIAAKPKPRSRKAPAPEVQVEPADDLLPGGPDVDAPAGGVG